MPKHWKVVYSGTVSAEVADRATYGITREDGLSAPGAETEVVADELEYLRGALVFSKEGTVVAVFPAGSYWYVKFLFED